MAFPITRQAVQRLIMIMTGLVRRAQPPLRSAADRIGETEGLCGGTNGRTATDMSLVAPGHQGNEVVVNAVAGICWEKTESTHGLKTQRNSENQGEMRICSD